MGEGILNKLDLIAIPEEVVVGIMGETVADIVCIVYFEICEFKVVWDWANVEGANCITGGEEDGVGTAHCAWFEESA